MHLDSSSEEKDQLSVEDERWMCVSVDEGMSELESELAVSEAFIQGVCGSEGMVCRRDICVLSHIVSRGRTM